MPEAALNEYGFSFSGERDVWRSWGVSVMFLETYLLFSEVSENKPLG
jgi:hypothetical protein